MTPTLYLASRSPRRKQLLAEAGIRFRVYVPSEDELNAPKLKGTRSARHIVKQISLAKAEAAKRELLEKGVKSGVILSADTLVFLDNKVLSKPRNKNEAAKMLRSLSGRWHDVFTGVALVSIDSGEGSRFLQQVRTRVNFSDLSKKMIEWYLSTGEPFDKAGAYGIQGHGAALVREIRGSYTNVVGLPVCQTLQLIERARSMRQTKKPKKKER